MPTVKTAVIAPLLALSITAAAQAVPILMTTSDARTATDTNVEELFS
jgi:hypothetical protein